MEWKIPPVAKVYEALSCIGSDHVEFVSENRALVTSSEGDKKYNVIFDLRTNSITSDDNGSRWQGYLGYPSIAVLMLKGALPFEPEFAQALKGIRWRKLNEKYKRNYDLAIKEALEIARERGCDTKKLVEFANKVIEEIERKRFRKLILKTRRRDGGEGVQA